MEIFENGGVDVFAFDGDEIDLFSEGVYPCYAGEVDGEGQVLPALRNRPAGLRR